MGVSMNPEALGRGATNFTNRGDDVGGHAATVADVLAFLGPAFGGVGKFVWPAVQAQMSAIERDLRASQGQITDTGTTLGVIGQGASAVDQAGSNAVTGTDPR